MKLEKPKKIEFTIQTRVLKCHMTFANKIKSSIKGETKTHGLARDPKR
jgi:hypothetical protein